jgi:hypothetical protein
MGYLLFGLAIAWLPAAIARNKGRSFWHWLVYGYLVFPIALVHAILLKNVEELDAPEIEPPR